MRGFAVPGPGPGPGPVRGAQTIADSLTMLNLSNSIISKNKKKTSNRNAIFNKCAIVYKQLQMLIQLACVMFVVDVVVVVVVVVVVFVVAVVVVDYYSF